MIELNINIERFNENGICLGCLNYNRKMFRHDAGNYYVKAFFKLLANIHVPDDLDLKVCWECYAAIRNVSRFQAQILKSYKYLSEYSQKQTFLLSPMDLTQYATQRLTSSYFLESNHVSLPEQIDLAFTSDTTKVELEDTNLSYYDGKDAEDVLREEEIYVPQENTELQDGLKIEYDIEEVNYSDGEDLFPEQDITWKSEDVSEYTGQDYVTAEPLDINLTQQSNGSVKPRAATKRTKKPRAQTARKYVTQPDRIKEGLLLIRNGASLRTASKRTGVCFITLSRYYWKTKDIPLEELLPSHLTPNYAHNKVFTPEQEIDLKNQLTHGALLTTKEYRKVAYQYAKMNNLKMPATWQEKQMAGQDWWKSFKRRHNITSKKPETSAGDTAFHKTSLNKFHENFQSTVTNPCRRNLRGGDATIPDSYCKLENYDIENKDNNSEEIDLLLKQNNIQSKRAKIGIRKGNPHDKIKEGLLLIRNGETLRTASKRTEVPVATLSRYYRKTKNIPLEELVPSQLTPNYAVNKIFTLEQEIAFKNYFTHCARLTTKTYLKVIYQCAKMNNLKMPATWQEKQMASLDWWKSFKRRHDITLKKPETSAGDTAFNKNSLNKFYEIFQTTVTNPCQQNLRSGDATISDNNCVLENNYIENKNKNSEEIDLLLEQNNIKSKRAKTGRRKGNPHDKIKEGLLLIRNGASLRTASKRTGVCFITLSRYNWKTKDIPLEELLPSHLTPNYAHNKVFTPEQEIDLKNYFTYSALLFHELTAKEYRKVAYQFAKMNNLKMPATWQEKQMAGQDWWKSFKRRHNIISKKPETCNSAGDTAFHNSNVDKFYDNLEELMSRSPNFANGTRIYNLGETTIVQKSQDVLAPSDKEIKEKETSEETGTLITTCCVVSATGNCVPPVMIFPRNKFKDHKIKKTPPDTLELATPNGFMNSTIFPKAMEHFIRHTSASKENPCILIMDSHESHLSLEALELAKNSGVHIVTLHSQTSAKLQPLEVGLYGPFNSSYHAAMDSWMLRNPGKPVTITDLSEIVGSAFQMTMTPTNIADSFAKCGIFPYNRHVDTKEDSAHCYNGNTLPTRCSS